MKNKWELRSGHNCHEKLQFNVNIFSEHNRKKCINGGWIKINALVDLYSKEHCFNKQQQQQKFNIYGETDSGASSTNTHKME